MSAQEKGYSLIADVALFSEAGVLLLKYADTAGYDDQTGWFIPDASIKYLEHPERAAARLLKEQLNLEKITPLLDHIESFRGNDGSWHLTFHYRAALGGTPRIEPGQDVTAAQWFPLDALPPEGDVAHHGWALTTLKKMQRQG
jgi:ADP-ribose pyrophosphatase YjhB (NUDIX family)